ncbi:MAG: histidinol-phosphate transaminase [Anaerolineae bacterium]|nr:MAG: histidinol-phosphate transaminase [Anaerolineae bacterium]
MEAFVRSHIREMSAYEPVLPFEVRARQLGISPEHMLKLDANENPYGPLPEVLGALSRLPYVHIYPDPESGFLREALAEYTGVPAEHLMVGAGADELIDLIARLFLEPGDAVLTCPPTFGMYAFVAHLSAARVIPISRRQDFSLQVEEIEATVERERPKVLFLASPNNPDGGLISSATLERLLKLPVVVVLDEAYIEFAPPSSSHITETLRWENLIVLRTFSKWAGLAGLRVGYGAFPKRLMKYLWKIKQPYNVSVAAQEAARIALEHRDELQRRRDRIVAAREAFYRELRAIPYLEPYPSQANFILCRVVRGSAATLHHTLMARGVLVRYFNSPGLQDFIRISIGRPEEMEKLLNTLRQLPFPP